MGTGPGADQALPPRAGTPNYRNFILDEERGFLFAYVPKVACTNWKAVLRYLAGHKDYLDPRLAHDKVQGGLRYLDLTGPDQRLLQDAGLKKYSFVRNPYTRLLSAYLNKIDPNIAELAVQNAAGGPAPAPVGPNSHWAGVTRQVEQFRQNQLDPARHGAMSLEVFLLWLRDGTSPARADEHWQGQSVLLRWPDVRFDFIGRFESLAEDSRRLMALMGADIAFPTQKDVKFLGTRATEKVSSYFTEQSFSLCERQFSADFDIFGYPRDRLSA